MSAQTNRFLFVYDVDGEGLCAMHFVSWRGDEIEVSCDVMARQKPFFEMQKQMHEARRHRMVMKYHGDNHTIWAVEIGQGDFGLMVACLNNALDELEASGFYGGSFHAPSLN